MSSHAVHKLEAATQAVAAENLALRKHKDAVSAALRELANVDVPQYTNARCLYCDSSYEPPVYPAVAKCGHGGLSCGCWYSQFLVDCQACRRKLTSK